MLDLPRIIFVVSLSLLLFEETASHLQQDANRTFKLKPVDVRRLARERSTKLIRELADGALHMRESLLSEEDSIKCISYGHLFRILKSPRSLKITQSVVEAIAVVVTNERLTYRQLMDGRLNEVAAYFMEAAKALEPEPSGQVGMDAYLDLLRCIMEISRDKSSDITSSRRFELEKFLNETERMSKVVQLNQFKRLPAESNDDRVKIPTSLVSKLANRIDQTERERPRASDIRYAQDLIDDLKDEEYVEPQAVESSSNSLSRKQQLELDEEKVKKENINNPVDDSSSDQVIVPQVELLVPMSHNEDEDDKQPSSKVDFTESQLAILKFVKMRLEQPSRSKFGRVPKLSIQLAFDFLAQWQDLLLFAHSREVGELVSKAQEFSADPKARIQAERVHRSLELYKEIVSLVGELRERDLDTLAQLGDPLERMGKLLKEMDSIFDTSDLWRVYRIWRAKYQEYSVIDGFINADSW